jgi:hypothetical protein
VVRRRSDPDRDAEPEKGTPFVKLPQDSDDAPASHTPAAAAALSRYDGLVAAAASCDSAGTACYDALLSQMDIDMYLRWIALANFVGVRKAPRCGRACRSTRTRHNELRLLMTWRFLLPRAQLGDYIDEIFFYTSSELSDSWHWYINAWDSARPSIRASGSCRRIELTCAIFLMRSLLFCSEGA